MRDLTRYVVKDLAARRVDAVQARGAGEAHVLKMSEIGVNRGTVRADRAPYGVTNPHQVAGVAVAARKNFRYFAALVHSK
jgi:hypothetical protein